MYAVRIVNVPNLVPRTPSTKEKGDLTKALSTCIRTRLKTQLFFSVFK